MAFYPELAIAQWIFKPALQFIDYTENDVQNIGWTKKKRIPFDPTGFIKIFSALFY